MSTRIGIQGVVAGLFFAALVSSCSISIQPLGRKHVARAVPVQRLLFEPVKPKTTPETNEQVKTWIDFYTGTGATHLRRHLKRSGRYISMMQGILENHGLPKDLVYIALIESGFNTRAHSRADAVGPWQFIESTGRRYGLLINSWIDERRDPVKSTRAAARYLKDLHDEFNDWNLAMAAYNAGEGTVRRAIKESGSRDFWVHADPAKEYLVQETRDYVPKYIAAKTIATMPAQYGFGDVTYHRPHEYDLVTIATQTDLDAIATCAGTTRSIVEELNPELKQDMTPPNKLAYEFRLPKGTKDSFLIAFAKLPTDERTKLAVNRVEKKKTKKMRKKKKKLSTIVHQTRKRKQKGKPLVLGMATKQEQEDSSVSLRRKEKGKPLALNSFNYAAPSTKNTTATPATYEIKSGDSLWSIARKYDVSIKEIKTWNRMRRSNRIKPGQKIVIKKE